MSACGRSFHLAECRTVDETTGAPLHHDDDDDDDDEMISFC